MILPPGSTSVSIDIQVVDDAGLPVTGLVSTTLPTISYTTERGATTSISLSNLSTLTSAFSSGGVFERASGYYRLDVPNAAFTSAGRTTIFGEAAGKRVIPVRIEVRNVHANAVQIASTDATHQHIVAGVSQIATPADLDIRLAAGDAARVVLGKAIFLGGKFRIPTDRGSGASVDEIALDDTTGLTPATTAYAYVQPWESGRPSTEGMTDHELVVLGALNTHGVSTHTAAGVWAVATRTITGGTVTNLTNLPAIPANWITAAGIADNAITAAKIASNAITSAKIATDAIGVAQIAANAIGASEIAAGALNDKGNWNVGKTGYSLTPTTGLGNQTANITGNLSGSVGSVTGNVGGLTGFSQVTFEQMADTIATNLNATVSSRLASASYTAPDNAGISTLLTRVPAVIDVSDLNTFADRYLTMIEVDGPVYRFTINALEQAPAGGGGGGGGDATESTQLKILKVLQAQQSK
jgi:hypothetical protein